MTVHPHGETACHLSDLNLFSPALPFIGVIHELPLHSNENAQCTVLRAVAERVGFEPTVRCYPYNRLASGPLRPLGHLSWKTYLGLY